MLTKNQKIEREFHDKWAESISVDEIDFSGAFEAVSAPETKYAFLKMLPVSGKKILDLGCGMGDAAVYFALKGAQVEAVDISSGMIKVAKKLACKHHVSGAMKAKVMLAEKLLYPKDNFDIIFGNGLLHHTVQNRTLKEVYRVLKPGGKAFFVEPLADNFIINIYRKLASEVRTQSEKPLKYSHLDNITTARFKRAYHHEFHLLTLLIFIWFYLINRCHPNNERYWKKIVKDVEQIKYTFALLFLMDRLILKVAPFLRRYCWNTVLVFEK